MIILIVLGMFLFLMMGLILVVISTARKEGDWGVNTSEVSCPRCGSRMPEIRMPVNLRQFLWGGGTCKACGCEVDKWGKEIKRTKRGKLWAL